MDPYDHDNCVPQRELRAVTRFSQLRVRCHCPSKTLCHQIEGKSAVRGTGVHYDSASKIGKCFYPEASVIFDLLSIENNFTKAIRMIQLIKSQVSHIKSISKRRALIWHKNFRNLMTTEFYDYDVTFGAIFSVVAT